MYTDRYGLQGLMQATILLSFNSDTSPSVGLKEWVRNEANMKQAARTIAEPQMAHPPRDFKTNQLLEIMAISTFDLPRGTGAVSYRSRFI